MDEAMGKGRGREGKNGREGKREENGEASEGTKEEGSDRRSYIEG